MKIIQLDIEGVYLIENSISYDLRGGFVKPFSFTIFVEHGLDTDFKETYYSVSNKNVVRGMHFQIPPFSHSKLVHVSSGAVLDVILDLRKSSKTFGKHISLRIDEYTNSIYIPKGCAHGFKSLKDGSVVVYQQTSEYNESADEGILWNSFGYDWGAGDHVLSVRDQNHPKYRTFDSPF
jgi:dTDP-4-dehydrorhamnose 3,5-epimerase